LYCTTIFALSGTVPPAQDGTPATLVPVRFGPIHAPTQPDALYAFDDDGGVRWIMTPAHTFSCGGKVFSAPWDIQTLAVSVGSGPRRVWVAYTHNESWPSFVVEVSADGRQKLRYFQAGWIKSLVEWNTPAGLRLAAGGVMNLLSWTDFARLDPTCEPSSTSVSSWRSSRRMGS
jgi:hypothetical protein